MQWNPSAGTGLQSLDSTIDWSQVEEVLVAELEALGHSECQSLLHGPLSRQTCRRFLYVRFTAHFSTVVHAYGSF